MIALSLYKNKNFKLINKKINNKLHPKKCRLKIIYSGICASDIPRAFDAMAYKYPLIMGHEFVGKIIKTGSSINSFDEGDVVSAFPLIPCCVENKSSSECGNCKQKKFNLCDNYNYYGSRTDGSFCEILDVYEWNLFKLSKKIALENSSIIEPTAVAYNIFNNMKIESKSKILIMGGGFIGQILNRIIRKHSKKTQIHLADRNKFKLAISKKYIDNAIFFSKTDKNYNYLRKKKLINKFDIVVETTGNSTNFINVLNFVKKDGSVLYSGNIEKDLKLSRSEVSNILRKQINIKGIWNSSFKSKINDWKKADDFLSNNVALKNLITHKCELENAGELLGQINKMKKGKLKNNYLKGIIKI